MQKQGAESEHMPHHPVGQKFSVPRPHGEKTEVKGSKNLISNAVKTLKGNVERTGDPLGIKSPYWTQWAKGLDLPREGNTLLFTARMYQMLPYVVQTTELMAAVKPLLATKGINTVLSFGNRLAGERVIRSKAKGEKEITEKAEKILKGIAAGLKAVGQRPGYLYESEPYSGVLLYDLGLEEEIIPHMNRVYRLFKERGIKKIITVDPHTTFMMKEVYPKHVKDYDLQVSHYLECLQEKPEFLKEADRQNLPQELVLHDSCVMTRDLGFVEEARKVANAIGLPLLEPENNRLDTACCGGPVEYAFGDLSRRISSIRMKELSSVNRNILVTCPICLINLSKYSRESGVRVWDMGEILYAALARDETLEHQPMIKESDPCC
jgi:Fe-S oxidoreductase